MRGWTCGLRTLRQLHTCGPTTRWPVTSRRKADITPTTRLKCVSGCGGASGDDTRHGNGSDSQRTDREEEESVKGSRCFSSVKDPNEDESASTSTSRAAPRSSMSNLLQMISQRKDGVNKMGENGTNNKRPTSSLSSSTSSGCEYMAQIFTSASTAQTINPPRRPTTTRAMGTGSKKIVSTTPQPSSGNTMAVSATLVEKLRRNVLHKQLDWGKMVKTHPSLLRLPIWQQRSAWGIRFLSSSALPIPQPDGPATFVCSAPTGCGKSSLVPLMLLHAHWERLLQRIDAPTDISSHRMGCTPPLPFASAAESNGDGGSGARAYVTEFAASSRVCIVVSQPTRLACKELAEFTASLIDPSLLLLLSSEKEKSIPGTVHVGGRVGYAVGGDVCFSAATEIIFATPGFIVNALQHQNKMFSPTTLVIDEAHCRDMETDMLIAWSRQQLFDKIYTTSVRLRQLVLMSATLPVEQMVGFLSSECCVSEDSSGKTGITNGEVSGGGIRKTPQMLLIDNVYLRQTDMNAGDVSTHTIAVHPFRIEEYFIDDLPDAIEKSRILHNPTRKGPGPSTGELPLLSAPARRVMASLGHYFSYTRFGAEFHTPQARILAQFLLFILQTLALTPRKPVTCHSKPQKRDEKGGEEEEDHHPESILVFLPGFSEMSLVLQSLELLCRGVEMGTMGESNRHVPSGHNNSTSTTGGAGGNGNVTFLQYEHWRFSLALLHSSAIGSPQQQLHDTAAAALPHRIILSTTVAESSVTIPNVRCVVDSCLERCFSSDPLTGVILRRTAVVNSGSSLQRGGRTGRTCDGVVVRLAPRRLFYPPRENTISVGGAVNAAALLLRVKHLFPTEPSALVRHLPYLPSAAAITCGLQQLLELGLMRIPESSGVTPTKGKIETDKVEEEEHDGNERELHAVYRRYDEVSLTAKGEFVAYLPIPHNQALLVYYGLQFVCVEDAILIACAMTVPTLLTLPRMTAQNENATQAQTPSMYYLHSLITQRELAKAASLSLSSPGRDGEAGDVGCEDVVNCDGSEHHLSEPLMLLSLLREWYACTSTADVVDFQSKYRVNRSSLRLVDNTVALCALRLYRLIRPDDDGDDSKRSITSDQSNGNAKEELYGEHDSAVRRPSTQALEQLIGTALPRTYRTLLANSLLRLHRCAYEHARHRLSQKLGTMTHWYPYDEQLVRQLQTFSSRGNVKGAPPTNTSRHTKTTNGIRRGDIGGEPQVVFGAVQHRLAAAFVAAFARNTMRGEDGAHRSHHRRLLRNGGALQEDIQHTCSFSVELHVHQQQPNGSRAMLYDRLTSEALRGVLGPYLAGTRLCYLDLFSSGRSAVAQFSEEVEVEAKKKKKKNETRNSHTTENKNKNENALKVVERVNEELLIPHVLPFEQDVVAPTNAGVVLAHIGISLLVSMQGALTRLGVLLPPTPRGVHNCRTDTDRLGDAGVNSEKRDSGVGTMATAPTAGKELATVSPRESSRNGNASNGRRRIRFSTLVAGEDGVEDVQVTWYDSYGCTCVLRRSDVKRAGYDEFFPTSSSSDETQASSLLLQRQQQQEHDVKMDETPIMTSPGSPYSGEEEHALLSVQRVTFTRAVYWKVTLPTRRRPQTSSVSLSCSSTQERRPYTGRAGDRFYCLICHSTWADKNALDAHCRTTTHLSRLALAVRLRMRREWVTAFSRGTLSDLLLRQNNNNNNNNKLMMVRNDCDASDTTTSGHCKDAGMGVELRHCIISSSSYMNALQWCPRGDSASSVMPIAIAGSLVAYTAPSATALTLSHSTSPLQALHVWVMDTERVATTPHTEPPLALFVLAGYLAASASFFDAALLMNEDHSRVYAVMLYDWGVWRFPSPLHSTQLRSVLRVFAGKSWRGVPVTCTPPPSSQQSPSVVKAADAGEVGGLHWCTATPVCPQCTYCGSGGHVENEGSRRPPSAEGVVASTLLLVLHEYRNSRRVVVSFADYIQRVVVKLTAWSTTTTTTARKGVIIPVESRNGAELLAQFVARRQNQPLESLLRSIGCQFLTPPTTPPKHTVNARSDPGKTVVGATHKNNDSDANLSSSYTSPTVSFNTSTLAAEGATNEKLFLLPTVLPSYLPSPDFAAILQQHRESMRNDAGSSVPLTSEESKVVQQPLF